MKSRGIVLHTLKYGDDQLISDVLTEDAGFVSMIVRISRSKRAAVRHSLFQPLTVLSLEWSHRPTAQLQRPTAVQVTLPFATLPYDAHKLSIGLFLAEVLQHAVKADPDSRPIFRYILGSLQWLDTCREGYANFHLVFLLRLTRFLGFMPNAEEARPGFYFDLRAATFTGTRPPHPDHLSPADSALVPKLLRMRYENMRFFRFSGAERTRLLEYINTYYRLHLPAFPELKSLAVMKEIFGRQ